MNPAGQNPGNAYREEVLHQARALHENRGMWQCVLGGCGLITQAFVVSVLVQRFALKKVQLLLQDHPVFEQPEMGDMGKEGDWT